MTKEEASKVGGESISKISSLFKGNRKNRRLIAKRLKRSIKHQRRLNASRSNKEQTCCDTNNND